MLLLLDGSVMRVVVADGEEEKSLGFCHDFFFENANLILFFFLFTTSVHCLARCLASVRSR